MRRACPERSTRSSSSLGFQGRPLSQRVRQGVANSFSLSSDCGQGNLAPSYDARKEIPIMNSIEYIMGTQKVVFDWLTGLRSHSKLSPSCICSPASCSLTLPDLSPGSSIHQPALCKQSPHPSAQLTPTHPSAPSLSPPPHSTLLTGAHVQIDLNFHSTNSALWP